ncbi:MAG: tRNA pseudouridine synthase A [Deltaproteobacteria bacterium]|jgi:tRNA pseudouridine38-40 synthase|nr:tRNA pseudouridine synthase A [Deltaproteobacteria bacterium]
MPRIKLTIAYVGTGFAGWQVQAENQGVTQRTVQGELEAALHDLLNGLKRRNDLDQPDCPGLPDQTTGLIRLHASGRTDSGVHADMQVAHFDAPAGCERINWAQALHRRLPGDISILAAETVAEDFHARFDCRAKIYTYALWLERAYVPPKLRPFAWACGPLNLEAMDKAAALLIGRHDFASFQNVGSKPGDTVRNLLSVERFFAAMPGEAAVIPGEATIPREADVIPSEAAPQPDNPYVVWRFQGDGFLKQMVRNLTGFLVSVGQGKLEPDDAPRILAARDRTAFDFPTAPAWGLTLSKVIY